ncbi:MAG: sn-glycerol-3-phosphate ABC transporter ATP-binding protein UgpC [bacterium]|nr:sn-glycerol-3-phosphate ABC transporter ATP-binding protein UgpC [bacterium]
MSDIALRNISKIYENKQYAVKQFNLDIHDRDFIIFVGPSGCGKSTMLRMIAGLEEISEGELWIDGELCNYHEPRDRGMSMVFQNYALYPNMTVYGNLAFALKVRKLPKKEIDQTVHKVAKTLEIEHLLDRRPKELSGGQKQRVAIGSAIVRKAKAFLMDEPLSNLDAKLRAQMRVELAKLHEQLEATIIYVTHDQTEAMTLGTKIVVMKDGIVQQVASPDVIYNTPSNLFVAGFMGSPSMNFVNAQVGKEGEETVLYIGGQETGKKVYLNRNKGELIKDKAMGKRIILGIRPEDIYDYETAVEKGCEKNTIGMKQTVVTREMLGSEVILYYEIQGKSQSIRLGAENQTMPGEEIPIYLDPDKIHIFDQETEQNLLYVEER